jgi:hypothetical protein
MHPKQQWDYVFDVKQTTTPDEGNPIRDCVDLRGPR